MFETLTFHELIGGLALILLIALVGALSLLTKPISTELWSLLTAVAGYNFGIQVPSGAQKAAVEQLTTAAIEAAK